MPQGLLQVNRFVTPQNLFCTVSDAINRAKSNFRNILPVNPTHSITCSENVISSQRKSRALKNLRVCVFQIFCVIYITSNGQIIGGQNGGFDTQAVNTLG